MLFIREITACTNGVIVTGTPGHAQPAVNLLSGVRTAPVIKSVVFPVPKKSPRGFHSPDA